MTHAPLRLQGLRVMLVEDEVIVALELECALHDAGCEVIGPAYTLHDAMSMAESAAIDVALLDVNLNNEMTFGLAAELVRRGVPVVLATGYDALSLPPDVRSLPRVVKPFTNEQLQRALLAVAPRDP